MSTQKMAKFRGSKIIHYYEHDGKTRCGRSGNLSVSPPWVNHVRVTCQHCLSKPQPEPPAPDPLPTETIGQVDDTPRSYAVIEGNENPATCEPFPELDVQLYDEIAVIYRRRNCNAWSIYTDLLEVANSKHLNKYVREFASTLYELLKTDRPGRQDFADIVSQMRLDAMADERGVQDEAQAETVPIGTVQVEVLPAPEPIELPFVVGDTVLYKGKQRPIVYVIPNGQGGQVFIGIKVPPASKKDSKATDIIFRPASEFIVSLQAVA